MRKQAGQNLVALLIAALLGGMVTHLVFREPTHPAQGKAKGNVSSDALRESLASKAEAALATPALVGGTLRILCSATGMEQAASRIETLATLTGGDALRLPDRSGTATFLVRIPADQLNAFQQAAQQPGTSNPVLTVGTGSREMLTLEILPQ